MRATALGALVSGVAWSAFVLAFVMGSLGPAVLGLLLLGGVRESQRRTRSAAARIRRTLPDRLEVGEHGTVRTEASSPAGTPLWVEDDADVPLLVVARRSEGGRGAAWHEMDVEAIESGTARWRDATVRIGDPWGLHERVRRVGAVDAIAVSPESDWLAKGRGEGQRRAVQTVVRGRRHYETTPQVETIREFHAGDRMRDVDWARSARVQRLQTRVRQRVMPRPVVVLVDATATMRHHRRRAKITTAARIAYGVVAAAQAAGVSGEAIVADERGVLRPSAGRGIADAMRQLGALDALVPVDALPVEATGTSRREDRAFLGAVSALHLGQAPPAAALDAATVQLARRDPALVVAILDAEVAPLAADLSVRRLRKHGHDVLLIVPATGAHHVRRADAAKHMAQLEEYRRVREALAGRMQAIGVPTIVAGPHDVEAVVQEVAKWAE